MWYWRYQLGVFKVPMRMGSPTRMEPLRVALANNALIG
jgi:hypothetical protein